jgi:DNA repair ATPase RecN
MRLVSLTLENFQCHKHLEVDLRSRLVSITGPSDVGKSAILRALRWVCLNEAPDDLIRQGAKQCTVTLVLDSGDTIQRIRGAQNIYKLNEKSFSAVGRGEPPQDIAALLQLTEFNFQAQHDAPFWFSETAGEVSRQLNAVIDLSVIDSSLSYIASKVRSSQERVNVAQERLDEVQKEWEEIEPQKKRVQEFSQIIEQHETLDTQKKTCRALGILCESIRENRTKYSLAAERSEDGSEAVTAGRMFFRVCSRWEVLKDLLAEAGQLRECLVSVPSFARVESAHKSWEDAVVAVKDLELLMSSVITAMSNVNFKRARLEAIEQRFHQHTKGKECPLCHQRIQ